MSLGHCCIKLIKMKCSLEWYGRQQHDAMRSRIGADEETAGRDLRAMAQQITGNRREIFGSMKLLNIELYVGFHNQSST